jgi:hypothetical protein
MIRRDDQNAIPLSMISCGSMSLRSSAAATGFWNARIIRRSRRTSTVDSADISHLRSLIVAKARTGRTELAD